MTRVPTLFIETDIQMDVDDLGALALAMALERRGLIRVAGVGVNTTSIWGATAIETLKSVYGATFPVGIVKPPSFDVVETDYAKLISGQGDPGPGAWPDAVDLLCEVLEAAESGSITVVSIGFYRNLVALLDRLDESATDPLSIPQKVERTIVMGGLFPRGREFNFVEDVDATAEFLGRWPTPIEFIGQEVGNDVITGRHFPDHLGSEHPLTVAYEKYCGPGIGRPSWDLIAVYAASNPTWPSLSWSAPGRVTVEPADGRNDWAAEPRGPHRYSKLAVGAEQVAAELDAVLHEGAAE